MNGPRSTDLHFLLEFLRTTLFPGIASVACLEFQCEREIRVSKKDRDGKRSKIILFFTRRYLGNRKSYQNEWKNVSKGKVPRFRWSFVRWSKIIILEVTAIQSFPNFNRIWSGRDDLKMIKKLVSSLNDDISGTKSPIRINEKAC